MSNTGIFGSHYADNNHLGVIPTLFAGAIVTVALLARRVLEAWRRSTNGSRDSLIDIARDIGASSGARDFPLIFALQLVLLFALESAEQLASGGRLLGGTAWLGAPICFSLIAHAMVGGLCMLALGACMRALVRTFASLVLTAVRFIWLAIARAHAGPFRLDRQATACARTQAPHVREIGGRAPPLLHKHPA